MTEAVKKEDPNYIKREEIEARSYQVDIANNCVNKDSLIVLPTGLGKTIVAILVVNETLKIFPPNSKIIVLAPTRPLINQHHESFQKYLKVEKEKFCILTGKIVPEKRKKEFEEHQIIFFTPQTLRNDLVNMRYKLTEVCLIIFDEAHHASGDYPYILIADEYVDQNPDGNILALTASPGATKKKITKLCDNLKIPPENIFIRTREDEDVKKYIKPLTIYKVGVERTSLMRLMINALTEILDVRLNYLSQTGFVSGDNRPRRTDLLNLNKKLINIINGSGDKTGAYTAVSINAQALILYHTLEVVEQQGLDVLLEYLKKCNKDAKKKNTSKAVKNLVKDPQIKQLYIELQNALLQDKNSLMHPKFGRLVRVLKDEIKHNGNSRILVFVKQRDTVRIITEKLEEFPSFKPARFVGQSKKSEIDKGLTQKEQIEILGDFKTGTFNILVSTNVGEEGLDIAECDLVVFYDIVSSEIRMIQREGRTARHREGKVVLLYTHNTGDKAKLSTALSRSKQMRKNLKNKDELKDFYSDRKKTNKEKVNRTTQKQYDLRKFIGNVEEEYAKQKLEELKKQKASVKLSLGLPMKYGLRNIFKENKILFEIVKMKENIIMFNKVLIQIYNAREIEISDLVRFSKEQSERFELVFSIIDFTDFRQSFRDEKRLMMEEFYESAKINKIQIMNVQNIAEIFFIILNIYNQKAKSRDSDGRE